MSMDIRAKITCLAALFVRLFRCFSLKDDSPGRRWPVEGDLPANVQTEEKLRLAHEEIETFFASISSILVCVDGDDRIRRWNAGAEQAFGKPPEEAANRNIHEMVNWDREAVDAGFSTCREKMAAVRLDEVPFVRTDGKQRLLGMTANPAPSESGVPGILVLAQDITEIKTREARVSHEMKMQSIGRLAAGIAHEINTPVQYLSYNLGFLKNAFEDLLLLVNADGDVATRACQALRRHDGELADALTEEIASAEKEADLEYLSRDIPETVANSLKGLKQVADIVSAMKEFSHPGVMDKVALDVNSALRNTVMISRNEWKHLAEVRLDLAEDLPVLYGLPQELNQVFLNLIMNASQAIEESNAASGSLGEIVISSRRRDGAIEVSFADTGPGIPEDIRSKIFEPFFTTKPVGKGTGQGLAISHAVIVQRFGGEIILETEVGKGSVFTVRLPERGDSNPTRQEAEGMLQS